MTTQEIAEATPKYLLEVSYNYGKAWHEIISSPVLADCHRRVVTCKFDGERLYRIRDDAGLVFWTNER